jgi:AraC-like DNA-binding protein
VDVSSAHYEEVAVNGESAFANEIPSRIERRFDALCATRLPSGGHSLTATDDGSFRVVYVSAGHATVRLGHDSIAMDQRDLLVLPSAATAGVGVEGGAHVLALRFEPGALALEPGQLGAVAGRVWSAQNGTASLLAHVLDALLAQLENYTPANPVRLQHHLGGFLAMAFAENVEIVDVTDPLLRRAKEHIEACLGDLALRPDDVAAAINVSTRTLNRLFEAGGVSVSAWIRQRRLERCRETLADPHAAQLTISSIGSQWGMCDAAHFSRSFKSAYGVSPREFRRDAERYRSNGVLAAAL